MYILQWVTRSLRKYTLATLHYITLHHITSHHITSHHITSHHITWHHITSHHITSHHITSHDITSHHITSHYITLHYITLGYCESLWFCYFLFSDDKVVGTFYLGAFLRLCDRPIEQLNIFYIHFLWHVDNEWWHTNGNKYHVPLYTKLLLFSVLFEMFKISTCSTCV